MKDQYKSAYDAHYKEKNLEKAFSLYTQIINADPDSTEARYAGQQIKNINVDRLDQTKISADALANYQTLFAMNRERERNEELEVKRQQFLIDQEQKRQLEIRRMKQKTIEIFSDRENTYTIENYISFNTKKNMFALHSKSGYLKAHHFSDLIDFEVYEDGKSVISGNAGMSALGAILFGATGAIIGASASQQNETYVSDLHIRLMYDDIENIMEKIEIISSATKKDSINYKNYLHTCELIVSALEFVLHQNKNRAKGNTKTIAVFSVADEIKKFKQLMDAGIISESEYSKQKEKLLDIDYNKIYFDD